MKPTLWEWSHAADGSHIATTLDLKPATYFIRPVYEPAVGIEWQLWAESGQLGQHEDFPRAVKAMEQHHARA